MYTELEVGGPSKGRAKGRVCRCIQILRLGVLRKGKYVGA